MIVIGDGQSARAVALSGSGMKLPVLWAKGGTANLYGMEREVGILLMNSKFTVNLWNALHSSANCGSVGNLKKSKQEKILSNV